MTKQSLSDSNNVPALSIRQALIPVVVLVGMLFYNVYIFGDDALSGSNQFVLLLGGAVAALVGFYNKVSYARMMETVAKNIKSTAGAILILLMVGALAGTWLLSGIIPTMIYYGLQVLNPTIFLASCVVICAVISIATGSSWTTAATVGIALIGIANALDISLGMTAGAILSGAYFGDKLSPLSDTTNLAAAMAETDLFTHIRYMTYTTVPTILITLLVFVIIGLNLDTSGTIDTAATRQAIDESFTISPWLFLVPAVVIYMIVKKTSPLIALLVGVLLAGIFAVLFQSSLIWSNGLRYQITDIPQEYKQYVDWDETETVRQNKNYHAPGIYTLLPKDESISISNPLSLTLPVSDSRPTGEFVKKTQVIREGKVVGEIILEAKPTNFFTTSYIAVMNAITVDIAVVNEDKNLSDLFASGGMAGMLGTVWLIVCAMVFGGIMEAIGALAAISRALLNLFHTTFGLFASTVASCLALNVTASDQYLAIVVPGKMFKKAYDDKGLAPQNLSRTLEDSGTVTSVLVPWNTCGAYHSGVLGVSVADYFVYAFFNWLSPFMTLIFAGLGIKIKQQFKKETTSS